MNELHEALRDNVRMLGQSLGHTMEAVIWVISFWIPSSRFVSWRKPGPAGPG